MRQWGKLEEIAMAEPIKLGISGLSVLPGTHLCAFFRGKEERDQLVFSFLREGLRCGHKCLLAVDYGDSWATSALTGSGVARVAGEMTWAVIEVIGAANLVSYEYVPPDQLAASRS
jgi:hypothetical protein